jgi:hypothetical protein
MLLKDELDDACYYFANFQPFPAAEMRDVTSLDTMGW